MSKTKVIPILTGTAQTFLLVQDGKIGLVDSGNRNTEMKVVKAISSRGLNIEDLQFIFLTHTHFDHAGNAATLKKLSGAPIIVHQSEAEYLRKGFHSIPNGTSPLFKIIVRMGRRYTRQQFATFKATEPDILFTNHLDLSSYGFDGKIINTPGHTIGASTLIVGNSALVGDTLFNKFGIKYPFFANNEAALKESWHQLLKLDVDYYYPAHGKRISKEEFRKAVKKLKTKKA